MDRSTVAVGPCLEMPIMHDSDRYDFVRDIGSGNFGVARLMRDKQTKELVAVKYIERGDKVRTQEFVFSGFNCSSGLILFSLVWESLIMLLVVVWIVSLIMETSCLLMLSQVSVWKPCFSLFPPINLIFRPKQ